MTTLVAYHPLKRFSFSYPARIESMPVRIARLHFVERQKADDKCKEETYHFLYCLHLFSHLSGCLLPYKERKPRGENLNATERKQKATRRRIYQAT